MGVKGLDRRSCTGEIHNVAKDFFTPGVLTGIFYNALEQCKAEVFATMIVHYPANDGFRAVQIQAAIGESHAVLETVPEKSLIKFTIETCGSESDPAIFERVLRELLKNKE